MNGVGRRLGPALDPRRPIRTAVAIRAPIERAWSVVTDLHGQPRWMRDLKSVRIVTPGPLRVGSRAVGRVRMFGLALDDPVEITEWEPPVGFALRHRGRFRGRGEIRLSAPREDTTLVEWNEVLVAPILPVLVGLIARPVFGRIFAADLRRLRDLVEALPPAVVATLPAGAEPEC